MAEEKTERNFEITADKFGVPYSFAMGAGGMMVIGKTVRRAHSYTELSKKYNLSVPRIQSIIRTYKWQIKELVRNYDGTELNL